MLRAFYHPGLFYRQAADQIVHWCGKSGLGARRVIDVGGSTGRLVYELHRRLTAHGLSPEFLMVEPSRQFCSWAQRLLGMDAGQDGANECCIPLPHLPGQPHFEPVDAMEARRRIGPPGHVTICCSTAENAPRLEQFFDLAVSLNVIDRHPAPKALVERIARFVRPGGLLVLGTPFDFREQFTPDTASWPRRIEDLLPAGWMLKGGGELAYHLRLSQWDHTTFVCRLVCAARV
jgi:SAM-dependent methyltransferase